MKLFFLSIIFTLNLSAFAQLKPIYFRGETIVQDSTLATAYGVYGKLSGDGLYALKIFDLNNNLKATGTYKDEDLKIPHGAFVYYEDVDFFNVANNENFAIKGKNRFVSGKGTFADGQLTGRWVSFFPNGKIMNVTTYVRSVKHGFHGKYNRNGKIITSGAYYVGEKDGEWLSNNGKIKEMYVKGVKQEYSKNKKN
ncbi:MAG: hypothetical protein V4663_17105 [Bacteroidota bacterium]